MRSIEQETRGFSLIELLIAMALGIDCSRRHGRNSSRAGWMQSSLVTQSSEMHQNARASLNLIAKDVSMAGSGLPSGGLALPYGAGSTPSKFAVDTRPGLASQQHLSDQLHVRHHFRRG